MKPFKGKLFPQINPSIKKDEDPLQSSRQQQNPNPHKQQSHITNDQFHSFQLFLQETQAQNAKMLSRMMQMQLSQTELLKEMLNSINKSVKIQTATYKMEKESVRSRSKNDDDDIKSIINHDRVNDSIVLSAGLDSKQEKLKKQTFVKQIETQTQQKQETSSQQNVKNLQEDKPFLNAHNQCEVQKQFKQKYLNIPIKDINRLQNCSNSWFQFQQFTRQYISSLLQSLVSTSFYGYCMAKEASKQQIGSFFCKNLIHNFIQMIHVIKNNNSQLWNTKSKSIINCFNKQFKSALGYFKLKFPQKKKTYVSEELNRLIPAFDNSEKYETFVFKAFRRWIDIQQGHVYNFTAVIKIVKYFINFLISETKTNQEAFQKNLRQIFVLNGSEVEHVIGTKIPLNTPEFTKEELTKATLQIKTPQIMRIIVKWIECLEDIIENCEKKPDDYFKQEQEGYLQNKPSNLSQQEYKIQHAKKIKAEIVKTLQEQRKILKQHNLTEQKQLLDFQSRIPNMIQKYEPMFSLVPQNDLRVGLFTSYAAESLYGITGRNLIKMINALHSFIEKKGIPFEVFDLLRAKCSGTMKQIKQVFEKLSKNNKYFKVIRVKNRLHTGNRDYLVNFTMQKCGLIGELQLNISDQANSQKQHYYDNFNHFLYELQRSKYGPVCEAVSIVSNVEDTISYFSINKLNSLSHKIQKQDLKLFSTPQLSNFKIKLEGFDIAPYAYQFICNKCFEFKRVSESFIETARQTGGIKTKTQTEDQDESAKIFICGKCLISSMRYQDVPKYVLKALTSQCFKFIPSYQQLKKLAPVYILIVRQNHRITYAYKKYKGKQYFKCMFGLQGEADIFNKSAPTQQISLDDKIFFNDCLIFTVDQQSHQVKFKNLSIRDNEEELLKLRFQNYETITYEKKPRLLYPGDEFKIKQFSCTFVFNNYGSFLLDIVAFKDFADLVSQYEEDMAVLKIAQALQKSKKSKWNLVGPYDENKLKIFQPIYGNCQQLYCEFKKMKKLPNLRLIQLQILKLKIELPCVLDFEKFWMPELKQMTLQLAQAEIINVAEGKLEKLQSLTIYSSSIDTLDFAMVNWPHFKLFRIDIVKLNRLVGFEENNAHAAKTPLLSELYATIDCDEIDLVKMPDTIQIFSLATNGKAKYPAFKNPKKLFLSNRDVDFKAITCPDTLNLHNTQNIEQLRNISSIQSLKMMYLTGLTQKHLLFDFDIPNLDLLQISSCLCEEIKFEYKWTQFNRLVICSTKIQSLDVSNLSSLNLLYLHGNNLSKLKLRDSEQMKQISTLQLDYNNYNPSFLEGASLDDLKHTIIINSINLNNLSPYQLQMLLPKLTKSEFSEFLFDLRMIWPDIRPFTQDDVILGNIYLSQIQFNFSKSATLKQLKKKQEQLISLVNKIGFVKSEQAEGYYQREIKQFKEKHRYD